MRWPGTILWVLQNAHSKTHSPARLMNAWPGACMTMGRSRADGMTSEPSDLRTSRTPPSDSTRTNGAVTSSSSATASLMWCSRPSMPSQAMAREVPPAPGPAVLRDNLYPERSGLGTRMRPAAIISALRLPSSTSEITGIAIPSRL